MKKLSTTQLMIQDKLEAIVMTGYKKQKKFLAFSMVFVWILTIVGFTYIEAYFAIMITVGFESIIFGFLLLANSHNTQNRLTDINRYASEYD